MSRTTFSGPRLPKTLLDQVQDGRVTKKRRDLPRKEKRKNERAQKKAASRSRFAVSPPLEQPSRQRASNEVKSSQRTEGADAGRFTRNVSTARKTDTNRKRLAKGQEDEPDQSDRLEHVMAELNKDDMWLARNANSKSLRKRKRQEEMEHMDEDEDEDEAGEEGELPTSPVVSKAVKARLEEDDEEIARLEKKLGVKGKSKGRNDDGLDWMLGDDASGSDSEERVSVKRKKPEDDQWLKDKRQRAERMTESSRIANDIRPSEAVADKVEESSSEGELSEFDLKDDEEPDDFEGFEEEPPFQPTPKKQRENPYVAPVSASSAPTTKYVPPSLRQATSTDEAEALKQLKRQLQGQLNRLSEANLLSILQGVEQFYLQNARQHVTSTLVELLIGLVANPSILNDTFLILHAGFATALYRIVGADFGAQLLEHIVEAFDSYHGSTDGKQPLNLLAFLSNLYTLQAVGCEIMFDYIRILLENFSEANTELLLRVIRSSGTQLRQEDPLALKDIVLLLQRSVAKSENLSVRTKFMIETIQDLKNNRVRANASGASLAAEHVQRMRKTLGSLSQSGRSQKATEPLRITLADIRDAEKKGKWWLVGASWHDPAKMAGSSTIASADCHNQLDIEMDDPAESDDEVDLDKLAREQGMNTDVRRAIFVAFAGAEDPQHAFLRIQKLNLKAKQQQEIPRVISQCTGAEPVYNAYYSLVGMKFCGDRRMRKAWESALLDTFRRLGENQADDVDEDDRSSQMSINKVYNLAKLYAAFVAEDLLRITVLKTLDFTSLQSKTRVFVETLLSNVFLLLRKKDKSEFHDRIKQLVAHAHAAPELVTGLKYYIATNLYESGVVTTKKERQVIARGCDAALEALYEKPGSATSEVRDLGDNDSEDEF